MAKPISDSQFSIIRGGLLDQFLIFFRVTTPNKTNTFRKIIFFILICWLPLLILNALDNLLWGEQVHITFFEEFVIHIRLLIAIPMMLASEELVDKRVKLILNQFESARLLSEQGKTQFELAKKKTDRMCESLWAEGIILCLIVINLVFRITTNNIGLTSWAFPDTVNLHVLSRAGYWALLVSFPLFQFIVLRWLWRWILWFRLLLLISKADLKLYPAHPDKAGGLGFLGERPAVFGPLTFILGIVFAAMISERVIYFDTKLQESYPLIAAFAILALIINILPLLSFVIPIGNCRRKGVFDYNKLISNHQYQFAEKWIENPNEKETLLSNSDASTIADLGMLYESIKQMKPFPFDIKVMIANVIVALLPLLPVLASQLPLVEIFKMLISILM